MAAIPKQWVILPFLLMLFSASMAGDNYYWVGGEGSWSEINHWATSSGGSTFHAVVPGIHDNVYFDRNSGFTPGNNRVTINTSATCHTMIWDDAPNNPLLTNTQGFHIRVFGSLALQETMTVSDNLNWSFRSAQTGNTIRTSGNQLNVVEFNGSGGEWTLTDGLSVRYTITLTAGIFRTNNQQVRASNIELSGGQPKELHLGSSELNIISSFSSLYSGAIDQSKIYLDQAIINISNGSFKIENNPAAFDAGTSIITLDGYEGTFIAGFPGTFHEVNFLNTHATLAGQETSFHKVTFHKNGIIEGNNTFESLLFSAGKSYVLEADKTQTIVDGISLDAPACTNPIIITSSQKNTAAYLQKATGSVNGNNLVLQDIHARGGATFRADASVDLGNNDGWLFTSGVPTSYYWIGGEGNWSDGNNWSHSSGGAPANCIPTAFDNVFFDPASGFTTEANSVVIDGPAFCKNMSWNGAPGNPALKTYGENYINVYGSLRLQDEMNLVGSLRWSFQSSQTGNTIKTSGNQLYSVEFNGSGGEWTLSDALKVIFSITLTEGSFRTDGREVNASGLSLMGEQPTALYLGSSVLNLNVSFNSYHPVGTQHTIIHLEQAIINIAVGNFSIENFPKEFDAGTSIINLYGFEGSFFSGFPGPFHEVNFFSTHAALKGQESIFHKVTFHGNGNIEGDNTFNRLRLSPAKSYKLEAARTQTIVDEIILDTPACTSPIIITSTRTHTATFLHKESGVVNGRNLVLQDIHARGGATFDAEASVDLGNNDRWNFTSGVPTNYYWIGGAGNWSDGNNWSHASGGAPANCIPTAFDNIFFDSGSGFTGEADAIVIDGPVFCNTMSWNGAPNNPVLNTLSENPVNVFGSLSLQEDMTISSNLRWNFRSTQTGNTIKTSGNRLTAVVFNGSNGEWTLTDGLQVLLTITLTEGNLYTNGQEVSAFNLELVIGQPKALHLSNSVLNLSSSFSSNHYIVSDNTRIYLEQAIINIASGGFSIENTPGEFDAGTSIINLYGVQSYFSVSFPGTFNEVNFFSTRANLVGDETSFTKVVFHGNGNIRGNNTFDTLLFTPGNSYQLQSNRTQTIREEFEAKGNPCFITNLTSSNQGLQAFIQMQAPDIVVVDFIILRDIHARGGATFIGAPNTTNLANNTGWDFTATPGNYIFGFGDEKVLNCDDLPYLITTDSFNPNVGTTFRWNDDSSESFFVANNFGQYHILVSYAASCSISDILVLVQPPLPEPDLGPDIYLPAVAAVSLDAGAGDNYSYLWSTGETTQIVRYLCRVSIGCLFAMNTIVKHKIPYGCSKPRWWSQPFLTTLHPIQLFWAERWSPMVVWVLRKGACSGGLSQTR
jgi:hypothetical protein